MTQSVLTFVNFGCKLLLINYTHYISSYNEVNVRLTYDKITHAYQVGYASTR